MRAPSVHNSQPWRWKLGVDELRLYADPQRQLPHTDPDRRDLLVSCGAALNHAVVAFAALGWQAVVHRFPDPAAPHHLATLELARRDPAQLDVTLASAIPRRRTDRRCYGPWPVSHADLALMAARVARLGVRLQVVDATEELRAIVARAVRTHVNDVEYLVELTEWSGRYGSVAGVPARNTPSPEAVAPLPGRIFAGTALAQPADTDPERDDAMLIALGTAGDEPMDRLRAGEATSMALLTATALGLASCPITEPLEVVDTRTALQTTVFGADSHPQMLLRIGWPPVNADPLPATPRRPLEDVID